MNVIDTTIVYPTPEIWNSFVEEQDGHFLQTSYWGMLKQTTSNWDYEIVALQLRDRLVAGALVLYWQAPLGLGTIAYIPRGPVVDWGNAGLVNALLAALDSAARRRRSIFIKIEPDLEDTPQMCERLAGFGLRASTHTIQGRSTILVDIDGTEESILARMNQGTRHKIRTAAKNSITVRHGTAEDIPSFHELMIVTGQRDDIGVRSQEYYRKIFDLFAPEHAALLLASYQGHDLGGAIALALGKRAWYLHGASSNEERNRMPNYAIQWEVIRWAHERGCVEYDLWGIPDVDVATLESQFQHRQGGMWGLYRFKRGFGGRVWRAIETWDRPYSALLYAMYKTAAALRNWWRARMHIYTTP